jgi:hypothetical protein
VSQFLDEHFVVWVGDIEEEEGYKIANQIYRQPNQLQLIPTLPPSPFLAVLFFDEFGQRKIVDTIQGISRR